MMRCSTLLLVSSSCTQRSPSGTRQRQGFSAELPPPCSAAGRPGPALGRGSTVTGRGAKAAPSSPGEGHSPRGRTRRDGTQQSGGWPGPGTAPGPGHRTPSPAWPGRRAGRPPEGRAAAPGAQNLSAAPPPRSGNLLLSRGRRGQPGRPLGRLARGRRGGCRRQPLKDQRGFVRSPAGQGRTLGLGSPRPPSRPGGPNPAGPCGRHPTDPPHRAPGRSSPSPAPAPGRGLKRFRGAPARCGWRRRGESSGSSASSVRGARPAGGRQRRAPASRAQGYGSRRTGSYQLLAFPRGEKVRARLGGEGGERDKNGVRRFVPSTACPRAQAAAGVAPPAPRQGSGATRGAGAASAEARAAAARAGAAAGWTPRPGTPGQPGPGAAGAALVAATPRGGQGAQRTRGSRMRPEPGGDTAEPPP